MSNSLNTKTSAKETLGFEYCLAVFTLVIGVFVELAALTAHLKSASTAFGISAGNWGWMLGIFEIVFTRIKQNKRRSDSITFQMQFVAILFIGFMILPVVSNIGLLVSSHSDPILVKVSAFCSTLGLVSNLLWFTSRLAHSERKKQNVSSDASAISASGNRTLPGVLCFMATSSSAISVYVGIVFVKEPLLGLIMVGSATSVIYSSMLWFFVVDHIPYRPNIAKPQTPLRSWRILSLLLASLTFIGIILLVSKSAGKQLLPALFGLILLYANTLVAIQMALLLKELKRNSTHELRQ